MRIVTGREMLAMDKRCIDSGMPAAALMEAAGAAVADAAIQMLGDVHGQRIHILCGTGNNGGDGFVAARYLLARGARVRVFLVGPQARLKGEAAEFFQVLVFMGCRITQVETVNDRLRFTLELADLIIDAMLGTGARGSLREPFAQLVKAVNSAEVPVLAVDVPTGVDSNSGKVLPVAVRAHHTVTFALPKLGLLLYPGAEYVGKLTVADIGFPPCHLTWQPEGWPTRKWLLPEVIAAWQRLRHPCSHKGNYGHVLVVAGSAGMTGAGELTVRAALRSGAGLVSWGGPHSLWGVMAGKTTDAMTLGLPETAPGILSVEAAPVIMERLGPGTVLAIGPGLGRHEATMQCVQTVILESRVPTVIDADGLYALGGLDTQRVTGDHPNWVLTPHPGEAARLLGCSTEAVEEDRPKTLRALTERYGCVAVLKGVPTLIGDASQDLFYVNSTGNPGMATGGSGDVLTGVIAGFLAQGLKPLVAAAAGAYMHGCAGDIAARTGQTGLTASDLVTAMPLAIKKCWEVGT